jgi:hypothetical protein
MSYCTCKLRHAVCPTERKWVREALEDARTRGDKVGIRVSLARLRPCPCRDKWISGQNV